MFKNIFKSVIPFFFLLLVAFSQNSFAQLSGSYTIPGAPFATVKSAFDSLNLVGVGSGGVTFNVTAGYTETTTDSLVLTATGTVSNPIVFQTAGGGVNPKITRTDAGSKTTSTLGGQGDAVITIQGSDYVTFNGIDVAADLVTIEYGYYLRKVDGTNGCKYVTIKNAVIDMTKGTSQYVTGVYSSNLTAGSPVNSATGIAVTSTGGRNEYVTIAGNTIQDVFSTIVLRGFNHTTAPYEFYDQNFVVGQNGAGNILQNYAGNSANSAYGVYAIYHNNLDVSYNTINNTANGGSNFTSTGYGIFHSTSSAANGTFNNNNINLSATTGQLRAITAGATGIGTIITNNNTITLSQAGTTEASGIVVQSLSNGSTVTMNYNTISFGTFASTTQSNMFANFGNAVNFSFVGNQNNGIVNKTGAGNLYCLNGGGSSPNANEIIANNTFDSITVAGSSTLYGIHVSTASTATRQAYNNIVSNLTGGTGTTYGLSFQTCLSQQLYNNTVRDITAGGTTYGLYFSGNNPTVYNNTVSNITTAGQNLAGIYDNGSQTTNCYKNQVYNLTSTYSGASTMTVCGIQVLSGTVGNYVYNNFISDIDVPNATVATNALFGINASASGATTKIRLYYNTIYLNSTSTGTSYKSYAIFSNSGHIAELRNNIAVNTSNGNAVAYGRSSNAFGTYSSLSDNNDFYAANIFHDGTTYYTTLPSYQTLVYPKDQASFSENPPFINTTTTPYDLHINTATATQIERGGRPVTTPIAITDDFDGVTRDASFTDVGADEFSGTALDLTAPIIAYTPFDNTSSLSDRTLVANISDQAGVPTTAPGWPNLYWKKGISGTYTAVQPTSVTGSDYTFNFGSGVVPTDTVFYYIVARDTVPTTPNIRAFPTLGAGNYTFDPPAAGTAPTSPNSYQVTSSSLAGDYTVGTALFNQVTGRNISFEKSGDKWLPMENGQRYYGDLYVKKIEHPEFNYPDGTDGIYLTLTAAIADLNLRGVSSPVNFLLTDASYTTASGEIFPYVVNVTNEFKPTATNKVTIKPNTGVTSLIQGASSNSFIFKILTNYVNIDGSNSGGTDRNLTIENTSTTFPMVVLIGSTGTTPRTGISIKNTIVINGTNSPSTALTPAVIVSDTSITPSLGSYTSGYFTNIAIQNNRIQKSAFGVQAYSVAGSGNGNGLLIDSNIMTDTSANSIGLIGIQILGVDGATITNNNIGNLVTPVSGGILPGGINIGSQTINTTISNNIIGPINITSTSSGPVGIAINTGNANSNLIISNNTISGLRINQAAVLNGITIGGLTGNVLITKNRIYDIKNTYVNATSAYGAYAITLGSSLTAANITLANNFIWDVAAYGRNSLTFHNGYGVYISGGGGYNLYHNTISLTTDQTLATGLPACINISSSVTTPASLDIRNNIFANYQTVGTDRYAIICNAANTVLAYIDNNDYYTTGPNLGYLGSNRIDLAAWQTATGKDVNSISANPQLVSANDLHADPNFDIVDGKGFYLATVPQDIDGDTRNNPSDIGADEYTFTPPVDPVGVTASAISDAQIDVAFTPNANNNNVVIVWNTTGLFSTPTGTPPLVDSAFAGGTVLSNGIISPVSHSGLTSLTTYYYKLFSYNGTYYSSGVTANATTNAAPIAPPYAQDFEGTFPPIGWTNYGTKTWNQSLTGGIGGSKCARVLYNPAGTANLQMPNLVLPASPLYRIKFWWKDNDISAMMNGENSKLSQKGKQNKSVKNPGDGIEVAGFDTTFFEISTDGGTTWTVLAFLSASGPQANYSEVIQNLTAYAGQTISIRWRDWSDGTFSAWGTGLDNITIEEIPACPAPTGLTATVITNNSANIGWSGATTVEIDYGTPGHPAGTGTILSGVTANPYTLGGLTAQTSYDVYLRQDCGGSFSSWAGPLSFTTACDLVLAPWTEDFESGVFPPNCWSVTGAAGLWIRGSASGYATGTYSARADFYNVGSGSADLISVGYNAGSLTNPILKFDWAYATYSGEVDQLDIYYSTNSGASWTLLLAMPGGTNGILNPFNLVRTASYVPIASEWSTQSLSLPSGTNRVKFTATSSYGNNLYVDNIKVEEAPALPVFSISPTSKNFGSVYVGSSSANQTFTISNTGAGTLTIAAGGITIVGTDASQFVLTDANTYPINLTNGQSATVAVKFSPTSAGAKTADLQIVDNTAGSPHTAALTGVGATPPTIPYSTDFESFTAGQQVACQDPVNWSTWSQAPCEAEDAFISTNYAHSGTKSFVIVPGNDLIKLLNNQTTGKWTISFWKYIPTGKDGYFNTLNTFPAGASADYGMEVYFDAGGGGRLLNGVTPNPTFTWTENTWQECKVIIDLDLDQAEFWFNGTQVGAAWSWSRNNTLQKRIAANDFFGPLQSAVDECYFDDYSFQPVTSTFQLSVDITNGWNMVSIPGLHPVDQNVDTWWAFKDPAANVFKYVGGYQAVTAATPGTGYWMKHSGDRTYNTGDEWPAGGIQIVAHDPLAGASGWNLIGGYEIVATAALVTTNPPGQQSGPIYKYAGGYSVATQLVPGYGYWIKLSSAAQIIIPEVLAKDAQPVEWFPEDWGRIVLTDAAGINYTLYAVNGETDLSQYELPPAPMQGMYDFRFSSGRIAEDINSSVKTIDMSGVVYPLTVRVEGMDIRLMDETGKTVNVNLKSSEDVVISDATIQKLMVSGELIPAEYALEQNYPNPFNPSTVIEFSLPENVGNVKLSIYNTLGEKVAELVNTELVAGKYSYQWNAQNVATGMYIYELRTDKFVSVKKMLLLK